VFDIESELAKLPQKSGVYIMKDKDLRIIYIGKALNLRNRVRSYFRGSNHDPKARVLASYIYEFEYIVTDSELEALVMECNLIKKHNPKYNIKLKDNKSYPYLKITLNESFPRAFLTRKAAKDRAKYYGPYYPASAVKETLDIIQRVWPIRQCDKAFPKDIGKSRPCLNYHIGKCKAPCNALIDEDEYGKMIDEVILFLNGKYDSILKRMESEMAALAEGLRFEEAAEMRDKISAVKLIMEKQKANAVNGGDTDVIVFAENEEEALFYVFFIRSGKICGNERFLILKAGEAPREEIMTAFVTQFYNDTSFIPKEIVIETDINDRELISKYLSGIKNQNVAIITPHKGEKRYLVELARKNAEATLVAFGEKIKRERQKTTEALEEIKNVLCLAFDISRIEAYDISNTAGLYNVASMVVFEDGKPKYSDYRKFRIKTVTGQDDYACMEEVITRRFERYLSENAQGKGGILPDMIFIDGGKGQVVSAEKAMTASGVTIPVCGMVKDDKHHTRGLYYNDREYAMPRHSEGFKLVTRIQDEVHRFAIDYHRRLRGKEMTKSVLDDIPGVGPARRKALLKRFGSVDGIRASDTETIALTPGMNHHVAEAVYEFFHADVKA